MPGGGAESGRDGRECAPVCELCGLCVDDWKACGPCAGAPAPLFYVAEHIYTNPCTLTALYWY